MGEWVCSRWFCGVGVCGVVCVSMCGRVWSEFEGVSVQQVVCVCGTVWSGFGRVSVQQVGVCVCVEQFGVGLRE